MEPSLEITRCEIVEDFLAKRQSPETGKSRPTRFGEP